MAHQLSHCANFTQKAWRCSRRGKMQIKAVIKGRTTATGPGIQWGLVKSIQPFLSQQKNLWDAENIYLFFFWEVFKACELSMNPFKCNNRSQNTPPIHRSPPWTMRNRNHSVHGANPPVSLSAIYISHLPLPSCNKPVYKECAKTVRWALQCKLHCFPQVLYAGILWYQVCWRCTIASSFRPNHH